MKIADVINQDFVMALNKLLTCPSLPRPEVRKLKAFAAPIMAAQRKYQIQHSKHLNAHGMRGEDGQIIEMPLGNGMSKFKLKPETEAEFHTSMEALRSEDIDLPAQRLNGNIVVDLAKLNTLDELLLADLLHEVELDVVPEAGTIPNNVVPL